MEHLRPKTLLYRRSNFVTHLPVDYAYSPTHSWAVRLDGGRWRVGLTKFAVRMLGEMVDHKFETEPGRKVAPGDILGWAEGFKAISDLFCIGQGEFGRANPELETRVTLINRDPYGAGWLYEFRGDLDPRCLDVQAYRDLLDKTIERLLDQRRDDASQ